MRLHSVLLPPPEGPTSASVLPASIFRLRSDEVVKSQYAPLVFQHTGDVSVDKALDELYKLYAKGFESSKRLSACLYAIVLKYDLAYRRRSSVQ